MFCCASTTGVGPGLKPAPAPPPPEVLIRPGTYTISALLSSKTWLFRDARDTSRVFSLKELVSEKPLVLIFLRRLGCQLCRFSATGYEAARAEIEALGCDMIAVSFERLGEGSDIDNSFTAGGFWKGRMMVVDTGLYDRLFGRKGVMDCFYGLADSRFMKSDALAGVSKSRIAGNQRKPTRGFYLAGQFVIDKGGAVLLDKRQRFYGDDASVSSIIRAVQNAPSLNNGLSVLTSASTGGPATSLALVACTSTECGGSEEEEGGSGGVHVTDSASKSLNGGGGPSAIDCAAATLSSDGKVRRTSDGSLRRSSHASSAAAALTHDIDMTERDDEDAESESEHER